MYPVKRLNKESEKNFYKAWNSSAKLIKKKGKNYNFPKKKGESHVLYDYNESFRQALLNLGFDEVILKPIWEEVHVKLQYGPEAPAILDRVYYTASKPRPDIGISKKTMEVLKKMKVKVGELKKIFKKYKRGGIDPGDLLEELVTKMGIDSMKATKIINYFPELGALKPVPSENTLLSHFTTAWFPTLAQMLKKKNLPVQLFTTGWRYRREQKEDATHLKAHFNSSVVVMDKKLTLEDAENITRKVMINLGFPEIEIIYKEHNAVYYAPGTDFEVFARAPNGKLIEVADGGLYSPIALAKYGIKYPVFNLGPSLHRTVMIREGYNDVRNFTYPYEYELFKLTDKELASMVYYENTPVSKEAKKLVKSLERAAVKNKDKKAPVEVQAYSGKFVNKKVLIEFFEYDEGARLLGNAALNKVVIHEGNVYGLPTRDINKKVKKIRKEGVKTRITFLQGVLNQFVKELEQAILEGKESVELRVKMAKRASELNIGVKRAAKYYITSNKTRIEIKGPVFLGVRGKIV